MIPIHPLLSCIPPLGEHAYKRLRKSIQDNGVIHYSLTFQDRLLSGRARQMACADLGVPFTTMSHWLKDADEAATFVIADNLPRLTKKTAAIAAARIAGYLDRLSVVHEAQASPDNTDSAVAKAAGVSRRTIVKLRGILRRGCHELVDALDLGVIGIEAAEKLSRLPSDEQANHVGRIEYNRKGANVPIAEANLKANGIPDHLVEVFRQSATKELRYAIKMAIAKIRRIKTWSDYRPLSTCLESLEAMRNHFRPEAIDPHHVCDNCKGIGCLECGDRGWMPKGECK